MKSTTACPPLSKRQAYTHSHIHTRILAGGNRVGFLSLICGSNNCYHSGHLRCQDSIMNICALTFCSQKRWLVEFPRTVLLYMGQSSVMAHVWCLKAKTQRVLQGPGSLYQGVLFFSIVCVWRGEGGGCSRGGSGSPGYARPVGGEAKKSPQQLNIMSQIWGGGFLYQPWGATANTHTFSLSHTLSERRRRVKDLERDQAPP